MSCEAVHAVYRYVVRTFEVLLDVLDVNACINVVNENVCVYVPLWFVCFSDGCVVQIVAEFCR